MRKILGIVGVVSFLSSICFAQMQGIALTNGFLVGEIRFDESVKTNRATPMIPASWRLVSVSNGERPNSNNLWFHDKAGNVYMLQGFTTYGQFVLDNSVQVLHATTNAVDYAAVCTNAIAK